MGTILLIRHAELAATGEALFGGNSGNVHLSDTGRTQAVTLARMLSDEPIDCIQSGPLLPCIETAESLAYLFDLPVLVEQALDRAGFDERSSVGMAEAMQRLVGHFESLRRRYPDRTIAIVTHAEVIRAAWLHYRGLSLDFEVKPAGVIRLKLASASLSLALYELAAS